MNIDQTGDAYLSENRTRDLGRNENGLNRREWLENSYEDHLEEKLHRVSHMNQLGEEGPAVAGVR
jgi:hypothetical protein